MRAVDNTAVSSPIPTLILVGQYDVAPPPRRAMLTAATLPNAYLFEVPGAGHSLLSSVECTIEIVNEFLENPDQPPNADCLDEIEWPYFECGFLSRSAEGRIILCLNHRHRIRFYFFVTSDQG